MQRHYTFLDKICLGMDQALRALTDTPKTTGSAYPANGIEPAVLSEEQRKHAAGLMRVNHAGEICAQALYHGQSILSRTPEMQAHLQEAALEEGDHLAWCKQRLDELDSHPTYLSPFWYVGSFSIGVMAGIIGDNWSLGFIAETERQVIKHLKSHLDLLPPEDKRSVAILQKMESDEAKHRDEAIESGGRELPEPIKQMMGLVSKIMVKTAYWI